MKTARLSFLMILFLVPGIAEGQVAVSRISNRVEVLLGSQNEKNWKRALPGMLLSSQDRIRTGKGSVLCIKSASCELFLLEKSTVIMDDVVENNITVKILGGSLRLRRGISGHGENIIIKTPNSQIVPVGTDLAAVYGVQNETLLYVFEGKAHIANFSNPENVVSVKAYQMTRVAGVEPPEAPSAVPESVLKQYGVLAKPRAVSQNLPETAAPEEVRTGPEVKETQAPPAPEKPKEQPAETGAEKPAEEAKPPEPKKEEPVKEQPKEEPPKEEAKPEEKKEPWCKDPRLEFQFNFDLQYTEFNKVGHCALALMPEFIYCRIGIGLYLPVYYNYKYNFLRPRQSWYNHDEWDFMSFKDSVHDLWIKFLYIRYGEKGDPLYFRIGGLSGVTFANGFIMVDYSNMLFFPKIRRLGLELAYTYKKTIGLETLFNDLNNLNLYGGRFLVYPFFFQPGIMVLSGMELGVTLLFDRINDDNKVINWGLDLGLPLIRHPMANLRFGVDWATFSVYSPDNLAAAGWQGSKNWGFASGFRGNLAFLKYRAEYRYLLDGYIPGYFDSFYDIQREQRFAGLLFMMNDPSPESLNGFLVQTGFALAGAGEVGAVFEEYYGDGNRPGNKAKLYLTLNRGIVPWFYGTASYHKINVVGFSGSRGLFGRLYDENTTLVFDGGIRLVPFMYLKVYYQRSFQYGPDGNLIPYETYSTGFTVGF